MGDVNSWELTCASDVGMFLPFPVTSLGGCKSLGGGGAHCHAAMCCVSVYLDQPPYSPLGVVMLLVCSLFLCVKPVLSLCCGCSLCC